MCPVCVCFLKLTINVIRNCVSNIDDINAIKLKLNVMENAKIKSIIKKRESSNKIEMASYDYYND